MFNFNTTFTKGNTTFNIVDNEIDIHSYSAVAGNAMINHWMPIIEKQVAKANPSTDFDTLVKEINYLQDALKRLKLIKQRNCSYRNKSLEQHEIEVRSIGNTFFDKISMSNFSQAQELVLRKLSKKDTSIHTSDIEELYNPVTDDDSKLKTWWKELNAFDYKKYGVSKSSILEGDTHHSSYYYSTGAKTAYNNVLMKIENFKTILKEAGDDLLNWSDQKISLRFTKLGMKVKAYEIGSYVAKYNEHLKKKGVKRVDPKKNTSKGKLEDIIKSGNATQDEYWRYFKQASSYDATNALKELDLEHLFMVIESDLKCVKSKLFDKWDRPSGDHNTIAQLLCEKSETKSDYKKIVKWAETSELSESFMIKHKDHANVTEVMLYCEVNRISTSDLINDEFYHTCLTKIPDTKKYNLNDGLTWQYMVRMNDSEKIKMLKRIASTESMSVDQDTLYGLYHNVDYSLIKNTIVNSDDLLKSLSLKLVKENDHKTMIKSAKECANSLELGQKKSIFSKLTYDEKKEVISYNYKDGGSANEFTKAVKDLSDDENIDLLQSMIEDSRASNYVVSIFRHLKDTKSVKALREANKIVKAMENVDALPLSEKVIGCLSVPTKVEILNKGIYLKDDKIYHSYSNSTPKTSDGLGTLFFTDFRRQDVDKVYDSPVSSEYRKFLAHTMSKDELELCAKSEVQRWARSNNDNKDLQESFFRFNIDLFSYSFLKQFKDKESFKLVVGDRRNTDNRYFGQKLLDKMNVSNSIDFMFS